MMRLRIPAVGLLWVLGVACGAQVPGPMQPLQWMAGGTWHGEVAGPKGAAPTRIDTKIRSILGGKALSFDTAFNGKATYAGTFAYDAAAKQVVFAYPSADGDWVSGHLTLRGEDFVLDFTVAEASGESGKFQSAMHLDGPNDYTWTLYSPDGAGWKKLFAVKYHRVS